MEAFYALFIPPRMKNINGETILVTGAAGGIGKEICRYLVQSSDYIKLVLWDLNYIELENFAVELRENINKNGKTTEVYIFTVDISSRNNIETAYDLVNCPKITEIN